jgi:electron transfer flavoprotein beta subunit
VSPSGEGEAVSAAPVVVAALRFADQHPTFRPLTGAVQTSVLASGPSEADRCALEHALRLARALGGRCLAVTAGPVAAEAMLREALAVGADQAIRVDAPTLDPVGDDGSATAAVLAAALPGVPALVLCGDHSADRGTGSTPAFLAARLGVAQALGLIDLSYVDGRLIALRRLDGGRRERLAVPLPAVCSVEPAAVRLRRASLTGVLAAQAATIDVVAVSPPEAALLTGLPAPYRPRPKVLDPPPGAGPRERLLTLTGALAEHTPARIITPAGPGEAAAELLAYLRQHGYLPATVPNGQSP